MSGNGDRHQDTNHVDLEDDTDDVDDAVEELAPRTTLQAATAWIMTRNSELTFALAETELEKIEELILQAGLVSNMPVEKAWLELRGAVSGGRIAIWGQQFEFPANFELGDVWPRGPQKRLTASDLSNMRLIDVRGMALCPEGMITAGQTWCCRVSVQTDQLQSEFPPMGARTLHGGKPRRNHKGQAAWSAYLKLYPNEADRQGVGQEQQLARLNDALKRDGKDTIALATFKRLQSKNLRRPA
jgi:hypothetical protein